MASSARVYAQALSSSLESVSEKEAATRVKRFRLILKRRGMMRQAGAVLGAFQRIGKEREGREAVVFSAVKLSAQRRKKFKTELRGRGFVMEERVAPSLRGGVALVLARQTLIDATIQGKLKSIAEQLIHPS